METVQSKKLWIITRILPSLSDVLFVSLLFAVYLLGGRMLNIDSDLGRHLAIGDFILDTGSIPTKDILSHTREGNHRPPYEWFSQVLLAGTHRIGGLAGVIFLTGLIISATFTILYGEAVKRTGLPILSAFLIILIAGASSLHWLPRPHIFTFIFLTAWIILLETHHNSPKKLIPYASGMMILWANIHAGFIFGLLTWLAYFAGSIWEWLKKRQEGVGKVKVFLITGIFALIASVITPDGWGNWIALLGNNSRYILENTTETMSPNFHNAGMFPFLILLAFSISLPSLTNASIRPALVFLNAGMAMAALLVARNIPLFAISSAFMLSSCIKEIFVKESLLMKIELRTLQLQSQLQGGFWKMTAVILFGAIIILNHGNLTSRYQFAPSIFPVEAVKWLNDNPQQGNMFNEFNWGGYLEYAMKPRQPVFIDSQTDFYGESLTREYQAVILLSGDWEQVFEEYEVDWAIIKTNSILATHLIREKNWEILYGDDTAVIIKR